MNNWLFVIVPWLVDKLDKALDKVGLVRKDKVIAFQGEAGAEAKSEPSWLSALARSVQEDNICTYLNVVATNLETAGAATRRISQQLREWAGDG